jgi:hypothetical protein
VDGGDSVSPVLGLMSISVLAQGLSDAHGTRVIGCGGMARRNTRGSCLCREIAPAAVAAMYPQTSERTSVTAEPTLRTTQAHFHRSPFRNVGRVGTVADCSVQTYVRGYPGVI